MEDNKKSLHWLESQYSTMCDLLKTWSSINSGTTHIEGLHKQLNALIIAFDPLGAKQTVIDLPPYQQLQSNGELIFKEVGKALRIQKRPEAPFQILLCGHMDTVYHKDHPFQTIKEIDKNTLNGPGVTDMKGGLIVMLYALLAFEQSHLAKNLGWEILITSDEEIGSLSSSSVLSAAAKNKHLGFVYEPTISPEGHLASSRKGSAKFSIIVHGRSAHAGRSFSEGRNAIVAMAKIIEDIHLLNSNDRELTINIGNIQGGGAVNIVPDLCIVNLDIRYKQAEDKDFLKTALDTIIKKHNEEEGIFVNSLGQFTRPVKLLTEKTVSLLQLVVEAGAELGLTIQWGPSGGCCDGNNLAAEGLSVVDSLGVRGGKIHSPDEYILLDSLIERSQLSFLLLHKIASGEYSISDK